MNMNEKNLDDVRRFLASWNDSELVNLYESFTLEEKEKGLLGWMVYKELSERHPRRIREYEKGDIGLKAAILK